MLNKYWIEKLERGKQIREVNIPRYTWMKFQGWEPYFFPKFLLKENKELAIQVIEDLIIEYEQKIEGYVASKQIHTCTDQVKTLITFHY